MGNVLLIQVAGRLGWEALAVHGLRAHLNVVIPVATLFLKILVQVFSRDDFEEVMKSLSNLPLELMLIAMSFMLGALSGLSDSYIKRFADQSDADLYATLVILFIFIFCLVINVLTRFLRKLFGKLFVAYKQFKELMAQPRIPDTVPAIAISGRITWATAYCTLMAMVLCLSIGISVGTLAYVLHLIQ